MSGSGGAPATIRDSPGADDIVGHPQLFRLPSNAWSRKNNSTTRLAADPYRVLAVKDAKPLSAFG